MESPNQERRSKQEIKQEERLMGKIQGTVRRRVELLGPMELKEKKVRVALKTWI
jgi:hypothetical protein